jgi:drug/metabolite transporter (DMT)-like permease
MALAAGVGAPPSEFAPKDSLWRTVDPLMWPALLGVVVLAVGAIIVSAAAGVRAAAILCFLASASTAIGIIVTAGISDHRDSVFYAINIAVAAIPAVVAVSALTRREPH